MRLQLHSGAIRLHHTDPAVVTTLPLSLPQLLQQSGLNRFPPGEAALEHAITLVEDALMPHVDALQQEATEVLQGSGASVALLVSLAAGAGARQADRAAVERVFNRVVDVAGGLPARHADIPDDAELIATLVVVRELLHHAGYLWLQRVD